MKVFILKSLPKILVVDQIEKFSYHQSYSVSYPNITNYCNQNYSNSIILYSLFIPSLDFLAHF